jgi:hypothetical protein
MWLSAQLCWSIKMRAHSTNLSSLKKQWKGKANIVAFCEQRNIHITIKKQEVKEGWLGKPKGMLQILWEHGWISSSTVVSARSMHYSKDEKKKILVRDRKFKEASQ